MKYIKSLKFLDKAELVEEIKLMKQINDAMEVDIKNSDDEIAMLKKKENTYLATIKELEEKENKKLQKIETLVNRLTNIHKPKTSTTSADTRTSAYDDDSVLISCNLFIYAATCEEKLTWHMGEDHGKDTNYFDSDFPCDICRKWCR